MVDPVFWLGLSILLVAVSLTAVLVAALPALRELSRAARSAEKLFDTLSRELPPTLEAIRLTGMEIGSLTDDVSEGVQSAGRVVKQFDDSVTGVKRQAKKAQTTTRSVLVGFKAAWRAFKRSSAPQRRPSDRLPSNDRLPFEPDDAYSNRIPSSKRYSKNLSNGNRDYENRDYENRDYENIAPTSLSPDLEDYYDNAWESEDESLEAASEQSSKKPSSEVFPHDS